MPLAARTTIAFGIAIVAHPCRVHPVMLKTATRFWLHTRLSELLLHTEGSIIVFNTVGGPTLASP